MSKSKLTLIFSSLWKSVLVLAFILLTVWYFGWLQLADESNKLVNSYQSEYETNTEYNQASPSPSIQPHIIRQQRAEFEKIYAKYRENIQTVLLIQLGLVKVSKLESNRVFLLTELEKLSTLHTNVESEIKMLAIPASLEHNDDITNAKTDLIDANEHFKQSITLFKTYLNSGSIHAQLAAQNHLDLGTEKLLQSAEKINKTANEFGISTNNLNNQIY